MGYDCHGGRLRVARVQHRCCECPASIEPGEAYEYYSGVWDGVGQSFKTCLPCAEERLVYVEILEPYPEEWPPFGHLQSEMSADGYWDYHPRRQRLA